MHLDPPLEMLFGAMRDAPAGGAARSRRLRRDPPPRRHDDAARSARPFSDDIEIAEHEVAVDGGTIRVRTYRPRVARGADADAVLHPRWWVVPGQPRHRRGGDGAASGRRAVLRACRSSTGWRPSTRSRSRSTTVPPPTAGCSTNADELGVDLERVVDRWHECRRQPRRRAVSADPRRAAADAAACSCSTCPRST